MDIVGAKNIQGQGHAILSSRRLEAKDMSSKTPIVVMDGHFKTSDGWALRPKYFTGFSLKDIFESVENQNIIDFIKDFHFLIINYSICYPYFILAK